MKRPLRSFVGPLVLLSGASLALAASCDDGTGGTGGGGAKAKCALEFAADPTIPDAPLETPRWAFEPWISKDISDGPDTYAFVKGFEDRQIPVGAVVLDSPWETNYNTLVPNPERYPDFAKMVADLHAKDIRVVLWTTAFVNSSSYDLEMGGDVYPGAAPAFDAAGECGFFIDGGQTYNWWKGFGASIDFFNADARAWWHRQQDPLFAMGVDGFKLDFGDSYVLSDPVATAKGNVPHQEYAEAYYHDFYEYGRHARGKDFLTMVRAWDSSYGQPGRFYAKKEDAPVAWMGDNRRDDIGLADALDEMFRSSQGGYAVLGSDIGGYLDHDDLNLLGPQIPFDVNNFARWTAVGALSPFMQLHGRANLTPWTIEQTNDEIVNLYRYWSVLHHELVPFFYSLTKEAYAGGPMPLRPIGAEAEWAGDYRYFLGDAFLVAPLLDGTGKRDVVLPAGTYYDFFDLASPGITGATTIAGYTVADQSRFPLFVKGGAIIPLNVGEDLTGFGGPETAGKLTLVVFPDTAKSTFVLHDEDDASTTIDAIASAATGFSVTMSRVQKETILRVRYDSPASVQIGGQAVPKHDTAAAFHAASSGYFIEAANHMVWVKVPVGSGAVTITGV